MNALKDRIHGLLRWSERYAKTDMVYLATAGFWANANFAIVTILSLALSVAFANLLPKETFGMYQYLLSLSALLSALMLLGMNTAVTQAVARGYEGDLRRAVRLQLLWGIIPTGIGIFGSLYYLMNGNGLLAAGLVIIALCAPLTSAFNTYAAFLTGKREFRQLFLYGTGINLTYYGVMFLCAMLWKEVIVLIIANLVTNAFATAGAYYRTLHAYRPNDRTDAHTITYGGHLSLMGTFGTIIAQLDSVLVFHFLGPVSLALYTFASLVPERLAGLFKFVNTAALPKFANQTRTSIAATIISKTVRAALAGMILSIIYAMLAPSFFRIFFPHYADAIPFTQLYAIFIMTVAAQIPVTALYALRLRRELYVFNIATPLILLLLQVPLLLSFGIAGILVARILSNSLNVLIALVLLFFPLTTHEGEDTSPQRVPRE